MLPPRANSQFRVDAERFASLKWSERERGKEIERESTTEEATAPAIPPKGSRETEHRPEIISRINGAAQFTAIYRGLSPIPNAPEDLTSWRTRDPPLRGVRTAPRRRGRELG